MQDAKDAKVAEVTYDEYLDYLMNYDYGVAGSPASLSREGYSSMQEWADAFAAEFDITFTVDDAIANLVGVGAETWDEYLVSAREALDGKFEETINYFEIKLSVSEYKNGNWMPSRISEDYIESDQKNSALALLDENQIPATPGDFNFYTTIDDDVVTVECLQTLRYTDGDLRLSLC